MTEGACVHFEFFARFILIIQACFFYAFSLSLAYARQLSLRLGHISALADYGSAIHYRNAASLPPGGSLSHNTFFACLLFAFCSSALASFEPRDYRVVFVIQKTEAQIAPLPNRVLPVLFFMRSPLPWG